MDVFSDTTGEKYIYRYRQMNMFALDELLTNYVYLASIDELNDPFELNVDLDESILEMSRDEKLDWLLSPSNVSLDFKKKIIDDIHNDPEGFEEKLNSIVKEAYSGMRSELLDKETPFQNHRVACFSKSPFYPTMVSHYCGNNGIVIAYDRELLEKSGCALGEVV